jgi:hypothetical protein
MKKQLLLLMLLPLTAQAQESRIATLQGARALAITQGKATSNLMVTSNKSVMIHLKDGKLVVGNETMDMENTTLRLKTLPKFAIDEDSTAFSGKYSVDFGLVAFRRTMNVGQWNSLVLPFSLTGSQVTDAFGEDSQLATLTGVSDGAEPAVEFQTVDLNTAEVVLKANEHYLIKPSRQPDIAAGSQTSVAYGSGKVAGPVYAIGGVTMAKSQTPKYQSLQSADKSTSIRVRGIYNASEIAVNTNPRYVLGDEGRFYQIADNTFFDPTRKQEKKEAYVFRTEYRLEAGYVQHWQRAHDISFTDMYLHGVRLGATFTFILPKQFSMQTNQIFTLLLYWTCSL